MTYFVGAGVLLQSVTDVWHETNPFQCSAQLLWVLQVHFLFLDFYFQLCPDFQLTTSLLSLSILIGSVLFAILWQKHLCIWNISLWLNMVMVEFILTLMVLSRLSVTHASHHTTLPAWKMPHQGKNTLVLLWNVKSMNLQLIFISFTFCFI